jgi:hypothetical protein
MQVKLKYNVMARSKHIERPVLCVSVLSCVVTQAVESINGRGLNGEIPNVKIWIMDVRLLMRSNEKVLVRSETM